MADISNAARITMRVRSLRFAAVVATLSLLGAGTPPPLVYPATKTVPVIDTYFGTVVADPYRWLEDGKDPEVKAWAAAETKLAVDYLEATPSYAAFKARIAALSRTSTERFGLRMRGGRLFYLRQTPPQEQAELVVRDGLRGTERVLFDPASAAVNGVAPAIETLAVAPDGTKVAFSTQLGGSEDETVHVVDTRTGKLLADTIPHAGGGTSSLAIAWDGDGNGFLHTRWPQTPDGSYATAGILIYHHVLGTDPARDTYVFGKGLSPKAEYFLTSSLDGHVQAAVETDGDGVHASVYLRKNGGPFARVATPDAGIGNSGDPAGAFVGDAFYAVATKRDSRGEVVALEPGGSFERAKVVVPASNVVVTGIAPLHGGFATLDIDGGDGSARLFATGGALRRTLPVPPISTLTALAEDPRGGPIVIGYFNYTTPNKWIAYDPATGTVSDTGTAVRAPGDFSNVVAERVFVPSLDGKVKIPLEIVHAKNVARDGTAPTVMTAYGAYGIVSSPYFDPTSLAWLERGGVYAQAMIRGGGEYGEAWHQAARLATKTVSSDDLAACAMWLGAHGYGNAQHLGIIGGSAGGFLMGLALTRNPELYRAVDSAVGIYDLLRVELTPNGAYNTPEFGTVKDPAQFAWMLRQSPLHNVHKGTAYPAVLMTTGENDPRVEPYMSRKMVATLQADSSSGYPVLLIQRAGQGHGIGNSFDQQVREATQTDAFFESQLR
jgi:prolyl oligopeptidase